MTTNQVNRPLTILSVVQYFYPTVAGAERFAQSLAVAMGKHGVKNIIATGRWEKQWKKIEHLDGLLVWRHRIFWFGDKETRRFTGISYMLSLAFLLFKRRADYDLMLVHQAQKGAFVSSLMGRILRKPVVVVVHCAGTFGDINVMRSAQFGFYTKFMISTIKRSNAFVAICSDIQRELRDDELFESSKISLIPDGIDPWPMEVKQDYRSSSRLITLARLHPQKGIDVLLKALPSIGKDLDWHLDICGDGPLRSSLEQMAASLGINHRVTFRGYVVDIHEELRNADVFVLPSRGEGMGIALLEAMYAGLPSVVTRVSGFVDIIENGVNGIMVESENPTALAAKLSDVMRNEGLRKSLGIAGRKTVIEHYTIDLAAKRYLDLMRPLVERHTGRDVIA